MVKATISVTDVITYIATHGYSESGFLTPDPQWLVNATSMLDWIHDETGMSKEAIGKLVDEVLENEVDE